MLLAVLLTRLDLLWVLLKEELLFITLKIKIHRKCLCACMSCVLCVLCVVCVCGVLSE